MITVSFGDWVMSCSILPPYIEALCRENPGTVVVWRFEYKLSANQFQCVSWSFDLSIKEFQSCRPVISMEGTHSYSKYKGTVLVVIEVDAND